MEDNTSVKENPAPSTSARRNHIGSFMAAEGILVKRIVRKRSRHLAYRTSAPDISPLNRF
jgi:hypothetical protein